MTRISNGFGSVVVRCTVWRIAVWMFTIFIHTTAASDGNAMSTNWSAAVEVILASPDGPVKGISRTCPFQWKDLRGDLNPNLAKMVFVPEKRLLWTGMWCFEHFLVISNQMVGLTTVDSDRLWAFASSTLVEPSGDGQSSALEHELESFLKKVSSDPDPPFTFSGREIDLRPALGRDAFVSNRRDARASSSAKIGAITFEQSNIVIAFEGANGVKATIAFDKDFNPLAATLDGKTVFPKDQVAAQDKASADASSDMPSLWDAAADDIDMVRDLLAKGADVNGKDKDGDGRTALMHAASAGKKEIVELLLAKGADHKARDKKGWDALLWALKSHETAAAIMDQILAKGWDVHQRYEADEGCTALHEAAAMGQTDVVALLLAKGADVNARDKYRRTPLIHAVTQNRLETAKLLIEKGADIRAKDYSGKRALFYAKDEDNKEMIALLERAKAGKK